MQESIEKLIHIVPIGYEVDRAVIAFDEVKADRVHLITMADMQKYETLEEATMTDVQRGYDRLVIGKLADYGIEVVLHQIDLFDIIAVMQLISALIIKEQGEGNRVYVNMSACGKIASIGATLAAMAHDVRLYYVRAERYSTDDREQKQHGISICRKPKLWQLENFKISLPDKTALKVLALVALNGSSLSCDKIIRTFSRDQVPGFEREFWTLALEDRRRCQTNYLMKLQITILRKLEDQGYITRKKQGRNTLVDITPAGRYVAAVSGAMAYESKDLNKLE